MAILPSALSASCPAPSPKTCACPADTGSGTTTASTTGWRDSPPARSAAPLLLPAPRVWKTLCMPWRHLPHWTASTWCRCSAFSPSLRCFRFSYGLWFRV
ncbi:unnamed protein product [Symbiodinium natans]|uniref:Uncharacterized protein n=1 Tax=Symbiodinium natans TaxID=878477 RepID=A0A812PSL8_9DINO|nr:unnamed protein product [Symbiodinium natans]